MTVQTGSLAVINADVRTMDAAGSRYEAVLIRDGVVALVGSTADIQAEAAFAGAPVIDAEGATVLPGFVDAHTHLEFSSYSLTHWPNAHTPPLEDLASVAEVIRQHQRDKPGDDLILVRSSFGMHNKVREGRLFTRAELDAIDAERPLVVAAGMHVMSLNTPAMRVMGILDMPDTPERVIHRDENGEPSGVVTEIYDRLPAPRPDAVADALRAQVVNLSTQYGVTTVASIALSPGDSEVFQEVIEDGVPLRLRSYVHVPRVMTLDDLIERGVRSSEPIPLAGLAGVKLFLDGQGGDGLDEVFDDLKWTQGDLDEFLQTATAAGIQVIMHAVTQTGVRLALTAIERTGGGEGNPLRHRIEHGAEAIDPADIGWAARIGALLLVTPQFLSSTVGEASPVSSLLRSILDAEVHLFGGTDTTGTVPQGASPLYNIACTIARPVAPGWQIDERLDFDTAVRLFTSFAAYAIFEEESRGSLELGKFGDLVILDRPVDTVSDPAEYFDLRVRTTVFAGREVYRQKEQNA